MVTPLAVIIVAVVLRLGQRSHVNDRAGVEARHRVLRVVEVPHRVADVELTLARVGDLRAALVAGVMIG